MPAHPRCTTWTARFALLIITFLSLFTSCSDDPVSPEDCHFYVQVWNEDDYRLMNGDTLYAWAYLDTGVTWIDVSGCYPEPNSQFDLRGILIGPGYFDLHQVDPFEESEYRTEVIGPDSVAFTASVWERHPGSGWGFNLDFSFYTTAPGTINIVDMAFRLCEDRTSVLWCYAWSDPISFTVIDTLPR